MVFKDFDLLYNPINDITNGTIEGLSRFEDYIDYGIHSTITKQMGDINVSEEKYWAKSLFTKLLAGDTNIFTSDNNIRKNILSLDSRSFYNLLIKIAIEYTAYKEVVFSQTINNSREEFICSLITDKMAQDEYRETLQLIMVNPEYKESLIGVYSSFKYGSEVKNKISMMITDKNESNTKRAIECLEFNLEYGTKGDIKRR